MSESRYHGLMVEDEALTESLDNLFHRNQEKPLCKSRSKSGSTPHGRLKKACRKALHETISNGRAVIVPIQNALMETKDHRKFKTGRKGAGDDIYLVLPEGWCTGFAISVEYKAGADRQSGHQEVFQEKWERAGGVYIVARSPEQLVADVLAAIREQGAKWNRDRLPSQTA